MQNQYPVDAWSNDYNAKKLNNNITRNWNIRKFNYQIIDDNYYLYCIENISRILQIYNSEFFCF